LDAHIQSESNEFQAGDEFKRREMAIYCLNDSYLVMRLAFETDKGLKSLFGDAKNDAVCV
jgi:hypothetical protein